MSFVLYEDDSYAPPLLTYLQFDAVMEETHARNAMLTEHPIEKGQSISDHVVQAPLVLTCEARVSNTSRPLAEPASLPKIIGVDKFAYEVGQVNHATSTRRVSTSFSRWAKAAHVSGGSGWDYVPVRVPGVRLPFVEPVVSGAERTTDEGVVGANFLAPVGATNRVRDVWVALRDICARGTVCTVITDLDGYESMVLTSVSAPREAADAITFSLSFTQARYAVFNNAETAKVAKPAEPRAKPVAASAPAKRTTSPQVTEARKRLGGKSLAASVADTVSNWWEPDANISP